MATRKKQNVYCVRRHMSRVGQLERRAARKKKSFLFFLLFPFLFFVCFGSSPFNWKGELPKQTIGHIQSAACLGQKEVVTAAHSACIRELLQEIDVHWKADRHMKLLTLERDQEQCTRFCSIPAAWAHYGIKNSVRSFARRMNCGKQRKRRK